MSQLQANPPQKKHNQQQRRGAILVLAVFTVPIILAFCAFAIDIGYIAVVDGELQNAADSAAYSTSVGMRASCSKIAAWHSMTIQTPRWTWTSFRMPATRPFSLPADTKLVVSHCPWTAMPATARAGT